MFCTLEIIKITWLNVALILENNTKAIYLIYLLYLTLFWQLVLCFILTVYFNISGTQAGGGQIIIPANSTGTGNRVVSATALPSQQTIVIATGAQTGLGQTTPTFVLSGGKPGKHFNEYTH